MLGGQVECFSTSRYFSNSEFLNDEEISDIIGVVTYIFFLVNYRKILFLI